MILHEIASTAASDDLRGHPPRLAASSATKDEITRILEGEAGDEIWSLLMLAARLDESPDFALLASLDQVGQTCHGRDEFGRGHRLHHLAE